MTSSSHLIAGALFLHAFLFAFQGYFPFVAENNPDLLLFFQLLPITLLGALFLDLDAEKSRISKLGVFQLPIFSEKGFLAHTIYYFPRIIWNPIARFANRPFSGLSNWIKRTFGHRKFFHSTPLWAGLGYLFLDTDISLYDWAFFLGIYSHMFADSLTKAGIPLFPTSWKNKWYNFSPLPKFSRIRTGHTAEYIIIFLVSSTYIIYILK